MVAQPMKPVFLFSLLRSGSTLLQRILATHADIATGPEPSILLPCVYSRRSGGIYASYKHTVIQRHIERFCQVLPNGPDDYLAATRDFAMALYRKAAGREVRYFLDKTPAYSFITEEVIQLFPDGKFIFLWRNPLAVVSSAIRTFHEGKWRICGHNAELHNGLASLIAAWEKHCGQACAVRYEDIVAQPEAELERLTDYLELPFDRGLLTRFTSTWPHGLTELRAHASDTQFNTVSAEPLDKWRQTLNNPIRKDWCRRYLGWIGRRRLAAMGYDHDRLLQDLSTLSFSLSNVCSDVVRTLWGTVFSVMELGIVGPKLKRPSQWRRMAPHT
jgi:hypothetical protein